MLLFGKALGRAIEELITIVSVSTFYRWCRDEKADKKAPNPKGGQRKPREIRELVIEIAKVTGFGYTRIIGELRKLGIKGISRQTVRNILKEEGIQPGPDRTSDCWENFIQRHGETLWACDFFSAKSITARGIRNVYLLVFLCMKTREVIVSSSTGRPDSRWVVKQTEAFIEQTADRTEKPDIVMHDRDTKFTKEFVATLKAKGIRTNALPVASPNLNGRVERFIQTIKYECLSNSFCSAVGTWITSSASGLITTTSPVLTWSEGTCRRSVRLPKKFRSSTATRSSSGRTWAAW